MGSSFEAYSIIKPVSIKTIEVSEMYTIITETSIVYIILVNTDRKPLLIDIRIIMKRPTMPAFFASSPKKM